jgi:hypothetical protein
VSSSPDFSYTLVVSTTADASYVTATFSLPPSLPALLLASCGTQDLYGRAASDDAVLRQRVEADGVGGERGRG